MSATISSVYEKVQGIAGNSFQIGGSAGPAWVNSSGALEAQKSGSLTVARGADPQGVHDFVPLGYLTANFSGGGAGGGGVGISAGTTMATSGTVVLADANGISFGLSGQTLTASYTVPTTLPSVALSAGTTIASSGTIVLSNANNVTFGLDGQSLTASASYSQSTGPAAVVAGTRTITSGTVIFSDGNNVSFGGNGQTITASASFSSSQSTAPAAIAAGGQTLSSGTVIFANANNVTFGVNGQTITGSASYSQSTAPAAIAAGTETASSGTVSFGNANGVSFGLHNGTVTASVSVTPALAIAADTVTVNSGTIIFSNMNGVTFGLIGSTMTASVTPGGGGGGGSGEYIAAGTQTGTAQTVVFAISNNVTFGMGGQSQVTASASYAPTLNFFENLSGVMWQGSTYASLSIVPFAPNIFPGLMTASSFFIGINATSSQSTASGAISFKFGVYTLNASTLSLLNSVSTAFSWPASSAISSSFSGHRWLSIHNSQWSSSPVFTQTNYWLGYSVSTANATQGFMLLGQAFANAQPRWGTLGVAAGAAAGSYGWRPLMGAYTAGTAAFPISIAQADLNGSFTNVGNFLPHVILNNAMASF